MDVWGATVCYNRVEAEKRHLPKPTSWEDLTKPVYKGMIVMPSPVSSGTGYLDVTSWLQTFGKDKGWQYMDALDKNVAQYVHSGSKPCTLAGTGEFPIGISSNSAARVAGARRPHRPDLPERRAGLGHGSDRHHEDDKAAGRSQKTRGLYGQQGSQ
jgi:ABC-type Fe3+ transport system, periplasmic component